MKAVIESIREYFDKCPLLDENARLNLDYIGVEDDIEYGIYSEPTNPVIKRYVDGGELRQHTFVFVTKTLMSSSYVQQLENIAFFDKFIEWVENQNRLKNLPILDENREPQRIDILTNGFLIANEQGKAQYQIQMNLIYKEEKQYGR